VHKARLSGLVIVPWVEQGVGAGRNPRADHERRVVTRTRPPADRRLQRQRQHGQRSQPPLWRRSEGARGRLPRCAGEIQAGG